MIKAVILARVSTQRQEQEGLSLKEIQLPLLREYAKNKDFQIEREFVFSESADYKIRKKFNEMVDFVKLNRDIKVIIAYRVDRITRNYRDAVLIDELRIDFDKEIHFVHDRLVINKDTVGRDIQDWDLKVFLAKQYLNRLKEDAVNSADYMLKNGIWPSKAPFGYKNIIKEDKKKWIVIDEFEAPIVVKCFEWYSTGSFSMLEIKNKIKEVFNREMSKGYVDFILKNPFYCGIMRYDEQEYPHGYDCLVSKELFDKVKQVKAGYNKKHFKFAGLPYAYRGLIRCSECGCILTPEIKKGKYIYYHCTEYKGKHKAKWIREEEITKEFSKVFQAIQSMPQDVFEEVIQSLKEAHKDKTRFHSDLLERYQKEYNLYEDRIEKMYEDKLDGRITDSYYDQKREEYRGKQKEINEKISKLHYSDEEYYLTVDYLINLAKRAYDVFSSSEPQEKRLFLKKTLQNLREEQGLVKYDLLKPYDKIFFFASSQNWLPLLDLFLNRRTELDYTLEEVKLLYSGLGITYA